MRTFYLALLLAFPLCGLAQDQAGEAAPNNAYTAFGGPSGVTREQQDIEDLLDAFRTDNRMLALKPWYDWMAGVRLRLTF